MRFFFFVSLSPFANTFCGEKREKRDERDERGERDYISPVEMCLRKNKNESSKNILKGANSSIDFFFIATS